MNLRRLDESNFDFHLWFSNSGFNWYFSSENGISREFINRENAHYFLGGSSAFAGVTFHKSQREYFYQNFSSNYGDKLSISIDLLFQDGYWGEHLTFYLNDLNFTYDFMFDEIINLESIGHYESLRITSAGIESDALFQSKFEVLENVRVNEVTYPKIFHFQLADFKELWTDYTITHVYYAQKTGLLKYGLNNGLIFVRK